MDPQIGTLLTHFAWLMLAICPLYPHGFPYIYTLMVMLIPYTLWQSKLICWKIPCLCHGKPHSKPIHKELFRVYSTIRIQGRDFRISINLKQTSSVLFGLWSRGFWTDLLRRFSGEESRNEYSRRWQRPMKKLHPGIPEMQWCCSVKVALPGQGSSESWLILVQASLQPKEDQTQMRK